MIGNSIHMEYFLKKKQGFCMYVTVPIIAFRCTTLAHAILFCLHSVGKVNKMVNFTIQNTSQCTKTSSLFPTLTIIVSKCFRIRARFFENGASLALPLVGFDIRVD